MRKIALSLLFLTVFGSAFAQPSIGADVTSGCGPLTVTFSNNSVNADSYRWFFSDSQQHSETLNVQKDTTVTFTHGGNYYVFLDAYDDQGQWMGTDRIDINVYAAPKDMDFASDFICIGDWLGINANVEGAESYFFDFGDGQTHTDDHGHQNHRYTQAGTYTVQIIYTFDGCPSDTTEKEAKVGNDYPVNGAHFNVQNDGIYCPGDEVEFYVENSYTYVLNYGDGSSVSSTPQGDWVDTRHTYEHTGEYVVTIVYQNGCGNDTTLTDTVNVVDNLPFTGYAYMSLGSDSACPTESIDFYSPNYSSVSWDMGDGIQYNKTGFEHAYTTPGTYDIQLTLVNGCGSDTTLVDSIRIVENIPLTGLSIDIQDSICVGNSILFDVDGSDLDRNAFHWEMGDGGTANVEEGIYAYENAGTFPIEVSVTNGCGNDTTLRDTVVAAVNVAPMQWVVATYPQQVCLNDSFVVFTAPGGGNTYSFDFGGGNVTSDYQSLTEVEEFHALDFASYAFADTGKHEIVLTTTNSCGISRKDTLEVEVVTTALDDYEVSFFWDRTEALCPGDPVTFFGAGANSYTWDFGDESGALVTQGAIQPVDHIYEEPGSYTITVTSQNSCGQLDSRSESLIINDSNMDITANGLSSSCAENDGKGTVIVTGGQFPYNYAWSSGDTTQIADSLTSGIYLVEVTDANGCRDFGIATVSDDEAPTIAVNTVIDVSCFGGKNGAIDINVFGGSPPYTIEWSNGKTTEDINNLVAGPYEVYVTDANGCISTESIVVEQPGQSTLSFNTTPPTCNLSNGSVLVNVNGSTGPYSYIWGVGAITQEITGRAAGIYSISVIDANGCLLEGVATLSDVSSAQVFTDSISELDCGNSGGSSIYISTLGGADPLSFDWSNGSTDEDLIGVSAGTYSVEVEDDNGCSSFASFTIEESAPDPVDICLVTVDTSTNTNKVVWSKEGMTGVDHFTIYRESSQSGLYYQVGQVPFADLSVFTDTVANPAVRSWRYKIAAVDNCDNESAWSPEHKTIHLTSNLGINGEVNLIWDYYEGFNYSTYHLWRFTDVNGWEEIQQISSNLSSFTDNNLPEDFQALSYIISIDAPNTCVATRAENHNSSRSNRKNTVSAPGGVVTGMYTPGVGLSEMSVYPNPAKHEVQIELFFQSDEKAVLRLYDMQGKLALEEEFQGISGSQRKELALKTLTPGIYTLRIETPQSVFQEKLCVE